MSPATHRSDRNSDTETSSTIRTQRSGFRGFSTRDLVYVAVLAAVWAVSENVLGAQLHAMNIPFSGAFLTAIGVFLMVTCRSFVPKPGSILMMGVVVALLRILSIGAVVISPIIAIFMEALLIELAMTFGGTSVVTSSIGGMLAEVWTFVHPFVVQPLLFGLSMLVIYGRTISVGSKILGIDPANIVAIILAFVAIHAIAGLVAGVVGWRFSIGAKRVLQR